MNEYDYVIVGAGAAGCVLANRLSEDPKVKVALVEAGPDRNARKMLVKMPLAMVTFMAPALAFLGGPKFMSWFETEPEPGLQGRKIALPRGRGVGGSTNVNGQIFIRGQREDFVDAHGRLTRRRARDPARKAPDDRPASARPASGRAAQIRRSRDR